MKTTDAWKPSLALKLPKGRAPCSAIVHNGDRILVMGPTTFDHGSAVVDVLSLTNERDELPRLPHNAENIMIDGNDVVYIVAKHLNSSTGTSASILYKADRVSSQLNSTITRVLNFFLTNFWTPVATLPFPGMVSVALREGSIIATGGWQMVTSVSDRSSSGWFQGLLSSTPETTTKALPVPCVHQLSAGTKHWTRLADLQTERRHHAAVAPLENNNNSMVLIVLGGTNAQGQSLSSIEWYDGRTWRYGPSMSTARDRCGATIITQGSSCSIVVAGGYSDGKRLKSVEMLDIQNINAGWKALPDLLAPRSDCGLCFYESQLIVCGGYTGFGLVPLDTIETLPLYPDADPVVAGEAIHVAGEAVPASVLEVLPLQPCEMATPVFDDGLPPPFMPQPSAPPMAEEDYSGNAKMDGEESADNCCAVCMDRPKQIAFHCGHQACLECAPLFEECHTCRLPIQGRIRLYG